MTSTPIHVREGPLSSTTLAERARATATLRRARHGICPRCREVPPTPLDLRHTAMFRQGVLRNIIVFLWSLLLVDCVCSAWKMMDSSCFSFPCAYPQERLPRREHLSRPFLPFQ